MDQVLNMCAHSFTSTMGFLQFMFCTLGNNLSTVVMSLSLQALYNASYYRRKKKSHESTKYFFFYLHNNNYFINQVIFHKLES